MSSKFKYPIKGYLVMRQHEILAVCSNYNDAIKIKNALCSVYSEVDYTILSSGGFETNAGEDKK